MTPFMQDMPPSLLIFEPLFVPPLILQSHWPCPAVPSCRTQLHYLKQLGGQAGHAIDLTRFDRESWIDASIAANRFESGPTARCIDRAIIERRQAHSHGRSQGIVERGRSRRSDGMDID